MPPLLTTQTQFFSSAYLMKIQSSYGTLGFMFQRLGGHFATSIDLNLNIGDTYYFLIRRRLSSLLDKWLTEFIRISHVSHLRRSQVGVESSCWVAQSGRSLWIGINLKSIDESPGQGYNMENWFGFTKSHHSDEIALSWIKKTLIFDIFIDYGLCTAWDE